MKLSFDLPMWLLRGLVRRNPWLLADEGTVTRSHKLRLGFVEMDVEGGLSLKPEQRARLLAERDAAEGRTP